MALKSEHWRPRGRFTCCPMDFVHTWK